ncbi:hypothetical protein [Urbifossiella limnaea]|uniref:hypothetical protein n=1 Tax=Urbifossiella limnaea TaxID=2528023 RepID=UPI0011A05C8B|nr:hypothetical protein [Urbifossiella limnaea]
MSLTSFIQVKDVAERLKPFRPEVRWSNFPLKVPRVYESPVLTGTAIEYLLRFELQRRAPHAVHKKRVVEQVPTLLEPYTMLGTQSNLVLLGGRSRLMSLPNGLASSAIVHGRP